MYRTSFSAVTSPKRVPKRTSPNQSNLTSQSSFMTSQTSFIATPLRATMPGRITSVDRTKQSCDSVDKSGTSTSNDRQTAIRISNNRSTSTESPPAGQKKTQTPSSAKYESEVRPMSPVNGDSPSVAPLLANLIVTLFLPHNNQRLLTLTLRLHLVGCRTVRGSSAQKSRPSE